MTCRSLAPYVLRVIARAQIQAMPCSLNDLSHEIRARRSDLRRTVSALHRQGYVDALRMRLTMRGLVLGLALTGVTLPELGDTRVRESAAA